MTHQADNLAFVAYSAAYATGRERGKNCLNVRMFDCQSRSDRECHGKGMSAARQEYTMI